MDWSSMHFSHASEKTVLGKLVREFEFGDADLNECGRIVAEFSEDQNSAEFRIESDDLTDFSWSCTEREYANFNSGSFFCVINQASTGWSHRIEIPVRYHEPEIFVFDDGTTRFRLAKVGKRFGDFFVIDPDEKAHVWVAGFDTSFFAMMRMIASLATLTIWRPKYYQPLSGSSALNILDDSEQRKSVIINATIRMFLDQNDFSKGA